MEQKETVLEKFENYEKSPLWESFENYKKNQLCLQDATDRLLSHMKGHGISFRQDITDKKGIFSQEKLSALVEKMLSLWEEMQREGTFPDPSTGKSLAEPYIKDRRGLYASYLYLVMRCSLCQGAYALVQGGEMKERTDFSFLLEQAKSLMKSWCVMEYPDGSKWNELFYGYDWHFGLHLYQVFSNPRDAFGGDSLDGIYLHTQLPLDRPDLVTDEGSVKRNLFKKIYLGRIPSSLAAKGEEAAKGAETAQPDKEAGREDSRGEEFCGEKDSRGEEFCGEKDSRGEEFCGEKDSRGGEFCGEKDSCGGERCGEEDSYAGEAGYEDDYEDDYDYDYDYDYEDDAFSLYDALLPEGYDAAAEYEAGARQAQRDSDRECLYSDFLYSKEYVETCERFVKQFRQAKPEVLRGFYEEIEEIVNLYLTAQGFSPLLDTDKVLDVYSSICGEALRRARRYERGIQWEKM